MRLHCLLALVFLLPLTHSACLAGPTYLGPPYSEAECLPNFETRAMEVLESRGMASTSTFFPNGEAQDQALRYPGKVCPTRALTLAVHALLRSAEPESLTEVTETLGIEGCPAQCYFNRKTSLLGLVADHRSALRSRFLPLPPSKGSVAEDWIFYLSVPDLDEHGYWALVSREGGSVRTYAQN